MLNFWFQLRYNKKKPKTRSPNYRSCSPSFVRIQTALRKPENYLKIEWFFDFYPEERDCHIWARAAAPWNQSNTCGWLGTSTGYHSSCTELSIYDFFTDFRCSQTHSGSLEWARIIVILWSAKQFQSHNRSFSHLSGWFILWIEGWVSPAACRLAWNRTRAFGRYSSPTILHRYPGRSERAQKIYLISPTYLSSSLTHKQFIGSFLWFGRSQFLFFWASKQTLIYCPHRITTVWCYFLRTYLCPLFWSWHWEWGRKTGRLFWIYESISNLGCYCPPISRRNSLVQWGIAQAGSEWISSAWIICSAMNNLFVWPFHRSQFKFCIGRIESCQVYLYRWREGISFCIIRKCRWSRWPSLLSYQFLRFRRFRSISAS